MKYGSVCSGIEAATMAWHVMGWEPVFFSEIEPFPCSVLQHHYPNVPNLGDMTKYEEWPDDAIDLLVGGTPCQSFSVAGLRQGLADPRGNLMLTYLAIARRYQPRWLVWENVPGVLSSNGGRDFGTFIRGLEECGYHAAWRVLDAQFVRVDGFPYAVPQRRRRVFVVGYLGDWRRAAAVLLEREGMRWDPPPSRHKGEASAPAALECAREDGWHASVAPTLDTHYGDKMGLEGQHVFNQKGGKFVPAIAFGAQNSASQGDGISGEIVSTLDKSKTPAVALGVDTYNGAITGDVAATLGTQSGDGVSSGPSVLDQQDWAVRRLTPVECERLQGFPDNFTAVPHRNKPAADGPRYKALGNSMAVNCMRWLGRRIEHVEALSPAESEAA